MNDRPITQKTGRLCVPADQKKAPTKGMSSISEAYVQIIIYFEAGWKALAGSLTMAEKLARPLSGEPYVIPKRNQTRQEGSGAHTSIIKGIAWFQARCRRWIPAETTFDQASDAPRAGRTQRPVA